VKKHKGGDSVQKAAPRRGGLVAPIHHNQGVGYQRGGSVKGGSGSGLGRLRASRAAAKVPDKTEL
jgi:hypothetical protein